MIRLLCALVAVLSGPALADVVIRGRDGSVHRVPTNPQDITSIEMVQGAGTPLPPPGVGQIGMPWVVNNAGNWMRIEGEAIGIAARQGLPSA